MIKLVCGLSKRIESLNTGSREASVSVEVQLERVTLRQPEKLKEHIRCGFNRIRDAIDEELARQETPKPTGWLEASHHHRTDDRTRGQVAAVTP